MPDDTALVPQPHGGAIYQGRPPGFTNPGTGRPAQITKVQDIILDAIENGNYAHVAAAKAGITEKTLYEWLKRGENGEEPYRKFSERLLTKAALAEDRMVNVVRSASQQEVAGDWKAGAWWLERRFPKRWGKQQRLEITAAPDLDVEW